MGAVNALGGEGWLTRMRLSRIVLLGLAIALCVPALQPVLSSAATSAEATKIKRKIVRCANREREERGLRKLKVAAPLGKAARRHAKNMLRKGFFDHVNPGGLGAQQRVDRIDPGEWGVGPNPAYTHIGGGFASGSQNYGRYYVQVFGIKLDLL